ncbi:hypothetical protein JCM33374_g4418 [Metschnikowia sp. JCM 33374]|nr:hypothetical protein JCM33374_g4418 [Metschnikowia sp. JCM 33374]
MPIDIISSVIFDGPDVLPGWKYLKTYVPILAGLSAVKWYFGGTKNTWKRDLHGKVFIVTGGTAGLGAAVTYELAQKGAQVILLCRSVDDPFTIDFIDDMREKTNNFMIYAEPCDLSSLHSVRLFATKWLDNQPPRRLDGVICCASETIPKWKPRQVSVDGVEIQLAVNYLAHFHLLTLLKPSLHVQPPDRDVRIVLTTCASQALAEIDQEDLLWESRRYPSSKPWNVYGTSKLLLGIFGRQFQRSLNEYERADKSPCNIRVSVVNPGIMRTPSTRRFLSFGTIWGLILYLILFPVWFIFFKDAIQGCQSIIFAILAPILGAQDGGNLIQECSILTKGRNEYFDYELQNAIAEKTEKLIEGLERSAAIERKKQEKALGLDKEKKKQEEKKKQDIHEKPSNDDELNYKLSMMRKSMGLPMGSDGNKLFSKEDKPDAVSVKATGKDSGKSKSKSKSRKR